MLALIGSHALKARGYNRTPKDTDIIGTFEEINAFFRKFKGNIAAQYPLSANKIYVKTKFGAIWEAEIAWEGSSAAEFLRIVEDDPDTMEPHEGSDLYIPSIGLLYALKMSHRYLKDSPHFLKTMRDIQEMRKNNVYIPLQYVEWFKRREKETYHYQHPNLNRSKKDFFTMDAGVPYKYDHDSIHRAVALYDKPAYNYYKADEKEVMTSKSMFFALDEKYRLAGVIEESYVLGLERSIIPYGIDKVGLEWPFLKALEKVCTSITSGWFREYAYENYDKIVDLYNYLNSSEENYYTKFVNGLDNGTVKLYQ